MSPLRLIILAVAAVAAIVAAILVRNLASQPEVQTETAAPVEIIKEVEVSQIKVLVAAEDLRVGTLLIPEHFAWVDWPEKSVSPSFITQDINPEAMEEISGSVVRSAMYIDEPVLPIKVVAKGETGFMAALLSPGMRAVAVEISPELASAGFILPDDRVDVILTYEVDIPTERGNDQRTVTETIMENARVLAIDQIFGDVDGVPTLTGSIATMELSQAQAELMALSEQMGQISLTLRSVSDADWNNGQVKARMDMLEDIETGGNNITIYKSGKASAGGSL